MWNGKHHSLVGIHFIRICWMLLNVLTSFELCVINLKGTCWLVCSTVVVLMELHHFFFVLIVVMYNYWSIADYTTLLSLIIHSWGFIQTIVFQSYRAQSWNYCGGCFMVRCCLYGCSHFIVSSILLLLLLSMWYLGTIGYFVRLNRHSRS